MVRVIIIAIVMSAGVGISCLTSNEITNSFPTPFATPMTTTASESAAIIKKHDELWRRTSTGNYDMIVRYYLHTNSPPIPAEEVAISVRGNTVISMKRTRPEDKGSMEFYSQVNTIEKIFEFAEGNDNAKYSFNEALGYPTNVSIENRPGTGPAVTVVQFRFVEL